MQLWFGKHKGELVSEIPRGYLEWLIDAFESGKRLTPEKKQLLEEIEIELETRDRSYDTF